MREREREMLEVDCGKKDTREGQLMACLEHLLLAEESAILRRFLEVPAKGEPLPVPPSATCRYVN